MPARATIGRYELLGLLSTTGMAEVSLACARGPGRFCKYVVIKRLPEFAQDERAVKMFLDEARVTAGFSHPNLTQLYELGEDHRGFYAVLELVSGEDLRSVWQACARAKVPVPLGFALSVMTDCLLALHYAHTFTTPAGDEAPVVHRDVAPKNLMVAYDGQVKLLDFGVAKVRGALAPTRAGTTKGTAGYMAPEQARGEPVDGRADVFAAGIVLWELVCGRRLFAADSELVEMKLVVDKPAPRLTTVDPSVPEPLADIVARALAKEPADRWPTAKDMAKSLEGQLGHLFYDVDERAAFMAERFGNKLAAARALYGQGGRDDEALSEAQDRSRRAVAAAQAPLEPLPTRPQVRRARASEPSLEQLAVDAAARTTPSVRALGLGPLVLGGAVMLVGGLVLARLLFGVPEEPSGGGLRPFQPDDEAALQPSRVVRPLAVPPPDDDAEPVAPSSPSPVPSPAEPSPPRPRARGDVVLALFPEARVLKSGQLVGSGNLVKLNLPVGTHALTVVGADGKARRLQVPVTNGKTTALRLSVDELPLE